MNEEGVHKLREAFRGEEEWPNIFKTHSFEGKIRGEKWKKNNEKKIKEKQMNKIKGKQKMAENFRKCLKNSMKKFAKKIRKN